MDVRTRHISAALLMGVAIAPAALAQSRPSDALQPVEPVIGDTNLLRLSTHIMPMDLRQPTSFDRVYRVPGAASGVAPFAASEDRFARISGGIAAVFPQSEYHKTKKGTVIDLPVNTVFYIGGVPNQAKALPSRDPAPNAASNAVSNLVSRSNAAGGAVAVPNPAPADLRVRPLTEQQLAELYSPPAARPDAPAPPANMLANDQYRKSRVRELLLAAAARAG